MSRVTKKEALRRRKEWNVAISEGRVVNFGSFAKSYKTSDEANAAKAEALKNGIKAFIVPSHLAQLD